LSQNRSSAVMQQRSEPDDSLDDFPTPPWGARALCECLKANWLLTEDMTCWEPAANRGFLRRGLINYFRYVAASDVHDYGAGFGVEDFLFPGPTMVETRVDWIITNPPFRLAEAFAIKALTYVPNVALLVRSAFLEGQARYEGLFREFAPALILQFTERLPMNRGLCHAKMTTATAYCWLVWAGTLPANVTRFDWIPPCRKRLEKASDYVLPVAT
jgi:hypothetical protein